MPGIFPDPANGGVAPSPSTPNGYSPNSPVIGPEGGPFYAAEGCTTTLTAEAYNAGLSEILAAVDLLGYNFDPSKITNLGEALARLRGMIPTGGTQGQALAINPSGVPQWGAAIDAGNSDHVGDLSTSSARWSEPGAGVDNAFIPQAGPVVGEGPHYYSNNCTTLLPAPTMNALTSEIFAAVDRLGFPFNANIVTNLGDALASLRMIPGGGAPGQALVINQTNAPAWGAPIDGGTYT